MGSVQEIHDRERKQARELMVRLIKYLRDHEGAAQIGEPYDEEGGFVRGINIQIGATPFRIHIHIQP